MLGAAGAPPELLRLQHRHQHLLRADRVELLPHDLLDLPVHAPAGGQPGPHARAQLADQPGAHHQHVRDRLRVRGRLLHGREEVAAQSGHRRGVKGIQRAPEPADPAYTASKVGRRRDREWLHPHEPTALCLRDMAVVGAALPADRRYPQGRRALPGRALGPVPGGRHLVPARGPRTIAAGGPAGSGARAPPAGAPPRVPDAANAGDYSPRSYLGGVWWYRKDFELPRASAAPPGSCASSPSTTAPRSG